MSLQKYFKSKEKLKIAVTNENLTVAEEKQNNDEVASATTHKKLQEMVSRHFHLIKNNDETLSAIYKCLFFYKKQKFWNN